MVSSKVVFEIFSNSHGGLYLDSTEGNSFKTFVITEMVSQKILIQISGDSHCKSRLCGVINAGLPSLKLRSRRCFFKFSAIVTESHIWTIRRAIHLKPQLRIAALLCNKRRPLVSFPRFYAKYFVVIYVVVLYNTPC